MKLSKLFHTLYATVMALPVLIIPIFALNILHKETEPISIEVQEKVSVDFNQKARLLNDWYYASTLNYTLDESNTSVNITCDANGYNSMQNRYPLQTNHVYMCDLYISQVTNFNIQVGCGDNTYFTNLFFFTNTEALTHYQATSKVTSSQININSSYFFIRTVPSSQGIEFFVSNVQFFDLTQMFGQGNEPTIQEFNAMFSNSYYPYTESQKMLVNKPSPTTYNSTDIGSQFVYALYKPVNDYFNLGEFFGLSGMYDWFQLNIFNGTAPLSFFIVYNVMIYWLFISLFWLIFDILIYVPMVIHKWLDKAEM